VARPQWAGGAILQRKEVTREAAWGGGESGKTKKRGKAKSDIKVGRKDKKKKIRTRGEKRARKEVGSEIYPLQQQGGGSLQFEELSGRDRTASKGGEGGNTCVMPKAVPKEKKGDTKKDAWSRVGK